MNRKNWLVIGAVVLLAVLLLALAPLVPGTEAEEDCVVIRLGNEEYARVLLSQPQTLTITQDNGAVNVVEVTENGSPHSIEVIAADCSNQICVHRGLITLDNWELMGGAFISCLPNQVLLELVEAGEP
mgnify:CR=1 FL=1